MSKRALAARGRRDANHATVLEPFVKAGWPVQDTSAVGDGFGDAVVLTPRWCVGSPCRLMIVLEIKTAKGTHLPKQTDFMEAGWPVFTVRTVDDALALLRRFR